MFSYLSPEQRVRKDRPLRAVTDEILDQISPRFEQTPGMIQRSLDLIIHSCLPVFLA